MNNEIETENQEHETETENQEHETETEEPDYKKLYEDQQRLVENQNNIIANMTRQLEGKEKTDGDLFLKYSRYGGNK